MERSVHWSPGMKLDDLEKRAILSAYSYYRENKTATANSLGISIRTLDNKLEKFEMDLIEEEAADAARKRANTEFLARARGQGPGQTPQVQQTFQTNAGVREQPIANTTPQPKVPVQKRQKV